MRELIVSILFLSKIISAQEFDSLKAIDGIYFMVWADTLLTGDPVSNWGEASAGAGADFVQANATKRAAVLQDTLFGHNALYFEAGDYMQSGIVGDYNFLHNGTGGTIILVIRNPYLAGNQHFLGTGETATHQGFLFKFANQTLIRGYVYNGTAAIINNQGPTLSDTAPTWHIISLVFEDSMEIKVDAGAINKYLPTGAPSISNHTGKLATTLPGSLSSGINSHLAYIQILNRALSDIEINQVHRSLYRRYFTDWSPPMPIVQSNIYKTEFSLYPQFLNFVNYEVIQ